ncbi:MAG: hypothetical protein L0215_01445 [Gemmataceae bacterium]|nr:hypothetical protein [Gemmataceae bacterium]
MIECRHCRDVFRRSAEKVGARCPTCRMPLYERDRPRRPVVDLGACAVHPHNSAIAKCVRCGQMMCGACRTRWDEELLCATCMQKALEAGETNPRILHAQVRQAHWSLVLAVAGWSLLLLTLWPLTALFAGAPSRDLGTFAVVLFWSSLVPAVFALGFAVACIRTRGKRWQVAAWSLSLAGTHLGLAIGLTMLNVWNH